jgi:SAM-dependent methyltransferase
VNYYHVDFDEELRHVSRAVQYFADWGREIESADYEWAYLKQYYSGYNANTAWVRFRALFFAMRLQPVLSYIEQFQQENRHPPGILDLGCGFGMETILLGLYGAQVHGVDASPEKIELAGKIKQNIEGKQRTSLDVNFEVANLFRFAPSQAYDAVYSSATLHHIEPVSDAIQRIASLIAPNGYFFLSDENGYSPVQQFVVQKSIGFAKPRKYLRIDSETGEPFWYGNENIRPPFLWATHMRKARLTPISIKYCRFLPPLDRSLGELVKLERGLRSIPVLAQIGAIGFLLTAQKAG